MSLRLLHTQWKARLVHPSPSKVVHTLFSFVVVVIDVMVSVILFQSVIIPLVSDFFRGTSLFPPSSLLTHCRSSMNDVVRYHTKTKLRPWYDGQYDRS